MKKLGFTLAEVLITLGIIGVVAALTTPSLVSEYNKSKVGPTLKRFVSNMSEANAQLLYDNETSSISSFAGKDITVYLDELAKYVKGARDKEKYVKDYDNYFYDGSKRNMQEYPIFVFDDNSAMSIVGYDGTIVDESAGGSYKGGIASFELDINGYENKPNRYGKDQFVFTLDDSGSIIPRGGKAEYMAYGEGYEPAWERECEDIGTTCSGSIFDNNGKVIYKY